MKIAFKGGVEIDLTWNEFEDYFSNSYSNEKFAEIQNTLIAVGVYQGGSKSESNYVLTAAKSEIEDRFKIPPHMIPPPNDTPERHHAK